MPEYTQRGFKIYGHVRDKYNSDVRVQESSGISGGVWIFAENDSENFKDPSPLLSKWHALRLIGLLLKYIFDWRRL